MRMPIARYHEWASEHIHLACLTHMFIGLGICLLSAPRIGKGLTLILGIVFLAIGTIGHAIPLMLKEQG